jgi:hypothetical protein
MNLLCPNCKKLLTVPDQSAGQRMQCPLCSGTFSVPPVPGGAAPVPPPVPSVPPPVSLNPVPPPAPASGATVPPPVSPSAAAAPPEPEAVYGFAAESRPAPTPPSLLPPVPEPTAPPSSASPWALDEETAPLQKPSEPAAEEKPVETPATPAAPARPCCEFSLNQRIVDWLPFGCFFLILILTLFTWVRFAPGGYTIYSQNGWQAAFNGGWEDDDAERLLREISTRDDSFDLGKDLSVNFLTLIYLIPILFLTLAAALACAIFPYLRVKIPPAVKRYLPWRAGVTAAFALIGLFLLSLQVLFGFSLEHKVQDRIDRKIDEIKKERDKDSKGDRKTDRPKVEVMRTLVDDGQRRSHAMSLIYLLQLLGLATAALSLWLTLRGERKPPRVVFYS